MGPAVLHGGVAEALLRLGQPAAAERAARAALDANDRSRFPRNRGLYCGRLAAALVERDEVDDPRSPLERSQGCAPAASSPNSTGSGRRSSGTMPMVAEALHALEA